MDTPPAAVAVVRVAAPWWAPRFLIVNKMIDALPHYAAAPGLLHKSFTFDDDGHFGGVYIWASRAAAAAWFNEAWHARVRRERGVDGDVRILDVGVNVVGGARLRGAPLPPHALRGDAAIAWLSSRAPVPAAERAARQAALVDACADDLGAVARVTAVVDDEGRVGVVVFFTGRAAGDAFMNADRRRNAARAVGGDIDVDWFDAPLLLDASAASAAAGSVAAANVAVGG
jgi:heme-degrading monooxygenase HmoA